MFPVFEYNCPKEPMWSTLHRKYRNLVFSPHFLPFPFFQWNNLKLPIIMVMRFSDTMWSLFSMISIACGTKLYFSTLFVDETVVDRKLNWRKFSFRDDGWSAPHPGLHHQHCQEQVRYIYELFCLQQPIKSWAVSASSVQLSIVHLC